jgi:hypothetical protein
MTEKMKSASVFGRDKYRYTQINKYPNPESLFSYHQKRNVEREIELAGGCFEIHACRFIHVETKKNTLMHMNCNAQYRA